MQELRDIKDIKNIALEFSNLDIFIMLVLFCLICLVCGLLLMKFFKKQRKLSEKQKAKINLKNLDFSDPKSAAYAFTYNFTYFIHEKNEEIYKEVLKDLEIFKYKKNIPEMDEDLKEKIKKLIKDIS